MGCATSKPRVLQPPDGNPLPPPLPQQPPPPPPPREALHAPVLQAAPLNGGQLADDDGENDVPSRTKAPDALPPVVTAPADALGASSAPVPPTPQLEPPACLPPTVTRSARLPPSAAALPPSPFSFQAGQPAPSFQAAPAAEQPTAEQPAQLPPSEPAQPPAVPSGAAVVAAAAAAAAAMGFAAQQDGSCGGKECYGVAAGDEAIMHSEEDRLKALRMLGVVQQPIGQEFGSITSLLKLVFDVPLAQAFLMEEHEAYSIPNSEEEPWAAFPRCTSHCRYMFEPSQHEMLIVEDMHADLRYRGSVWVTGPPYVRFYASAPLVSTNSGHRYGTICVVDFSPRHFSAQQYQMLAHLAEVAVRELESTRMLQWQQLQMEESDRSVHRLVRSLDCFSEGILLCDVEGGWEVRYANSAFSRLTGLSRQQAVGAALWSLFGLPAGGAAAADVQAVLRGSKPVTIPIGLLPSIGGPSGQHDAVSSGQPETGGLFTATFTRASSPDFRPDSPAIGIPIAPPPPGLVGSGSTSANGSSSGNSGSSGSSGDVRLWFVTLQRPGGGSLAMDNGLSSPASGSSTRGSLASGVGPATSPISRLQPPNLKDVQLGPLLGAGASGRAYRGAWFGTEVCVKVLDLYAPLSSPGGPSSKFPAAPLLEAALSKALMHPNIVPTHAWGVSEGEINAQGQHHSQVWIVQSLCTLGTLAHARDRGLFQDPATQGPDLRAILLTMRDVAAALSYLHSVGVVHGDLSGNNVLLSPSSPDERGFTAMVADFGLARPQGLSPDAVPRGSFGTVPNMPPELLSDDVLVPAADSWAFGTLLWELLSGRRAWRGMGPMQIIAAVTLERRTLSIAQHWPQGVQDLLRACLRHDPAERPTAPQLQQMVQALLDE